MNNRPSYNKQSGATLIVCLIILAIMTVLGLSSISSSNLELKMSASQRDHSVAFRTAETALRAVEKQIAENPYALANHLPSCTGNRCFKNNCPNGLCFAENFQEDTGGCSQVAPDSNSIPQYWQQTANWGASAPTIEVPKTSDVTGTPQTVKYLIEFLCTVPRDDLRGEQQEGSANVPLYRITVRAEGEANRSSVMLQSVFRGRFL